MGVMSVTTLLIVFISTTCQVHSTRFTMNIREKGTRFQETVEIDKKAQLQVYKVPAHNNISQSEILHDFKMGLTVYRLVDAKKCYIAKLLPEEPTPQQLRSNFQLAKSSSLPRATTMVSRQFIPSGLYPKHLLRKEVLDFCGNFGIYEVEPYSQDLASVENLKGRTKRNLFDVMFCNDVMSYGLSCIFRTWKVKCHMRSQSCFYTVTCNVEMHPYVDECGSIHQFTGWFCCDPFCP